MPSHDNEEEDLLRSVALQNAQSIRQARQRAEEELLRAKEALEHRTQELAHSLAMMRATLESTSDGIVVTDVIGTITNFNEKYLSMWRLPREAMSGRDHRTLLKIVSHSLSDPEQFLSRVEEIDETSPPESYDLLELADGRIFERVSRIQYLNQTSVGRVWSFRDITESREAEARIRKQTDLLRVTLASIGDAVITTDLDGTILTLNAQTQRLTGWSQDEALRRPLAEVFRVFNEKTREPVQDPAEVAMREGRVVGFANHPILIAKDGTEVPIDDSAAPILDDEGRIHGAILVFRDVTDRKKAEDALRKSERELSEFFDNATVGLHLMNSDGIIIKANRTELEMLGYESDEYIGHHVSEFHADPEVISDIIERLMRGEQLNEYEARMRCKDGSIRYVRINSNVLWENGRFVHTRCFTRDITGNKQASETKARLAAIVESSEDAIVSKDLNGRILSWNAGAERLFGYTAQEAIGRSITMLIPSDRQDEERLILDRLRKGERVETYQTVRVSKHGNYIDISLTVSPIRDNSGRVIGASKIARDITAIKRAERRLIMQNSVTRALAESTTLAQAAPVILKSICELLGWEVGSIWEVDSQANVLRCSEVWHTSSISIPMFEAATRGNTFKRGIGLPGRVWQSGGAAWVPDVVRDDNFPRAQMADGEGLHGAFAVPIVLESEVLGIIEFFSKQIREPDQDLIQMMSVLGSQIGQFVERKRAEAALRDNERRFRSMAESVPSIVWAADADGTIIYANERWYKYSGLTPEENETAGRERAVHPDDYPDSVEAWQTSLRQGTEYEIEERYRRYDGVYRWFVTRAVPLRNQAGEVVRWFGTSTDIDDRKHAEQTSRFLAEASTSLAQLSDYRSTLQRLATLAVPAFADWCTVDMVESDGTLQRLAVTHTDPEKVALAHELFRRFPPDISIDVGVMKVVRTGESDWMSVIPDSVLNALEPERRELVLELGVRSYICVPVRSRTRTLGVLSFVTAESGRVFDKNDLAAAEDLAYRAAIAIDNANLVAALKEADQRKDEFLAMLAHELRNPLAPIRNAVQIFRGFGPPVPELKWATEVIARQVHQMTRLVDDLLDVSRITRGKIELRKERVELSSIINSAVEASRPLIDKLGHELSVTLPARPIYLEADSTRFAQVILNLLNNAAKYTDEAGQIALSAQRDQDRVIISVKDTGVGIPPDMLSRVFDMFTQVEGSIERAEGGLGIGLTLVNRLVEMHGGTVEARSEGLGRGSEFVITLPVATKAEEVQAAAARTDEAERSSARRILVVDDNQDAADSLVILLRMRGNEVRMARDGLEAVGAAAAFRPDVVLLDIGLPKLNGYEAARQIREQSGGHDILMIALTGWGQDEDRRRSQEAGFDYHLTKPVDFDALQRLLAGISPLRPKGRGTHS